MKKLFSLTILLSLIFAFVLGTAGVQPASASPEEQVGVGRIRFGNATVTGSFVQVQIDNQQVANKLEHLVGYFTFNSGEHTIIFRTEGGGAEIARTTVNLEPATRMTVTLVGSTSSPSIVVTVDNAAPPIRGQSRFRVVNSVEGNGGAPVTLSGETIVDSLAFANASDEFDVWAGTYVLQLGDKTAFEVVLLPGRYYQFHITGGSDTATPRLVEFYGRPYNVSGNNRFRFMNLVEAPEGVDKPVYSVYVNNDTIPVYQNVDFGQATNEVVVQPGGYEFIVTNQGDPIDTANPVASLQIDIAENQSIFIIATGTLDDVSLNIFADNVDPVPVNTARLQVINLTTAIPEFGIVGPNDVRLIDVAPYASSVATQIPGGLYNLRLVDPNQPDGQIGRAEVNAPSGNLATLIVYGTDSQQWLWFNEGLQQVAVVRAVHAAPEAGPVDIYLNGELMLSNFSYLNTTDYLTIEPGDYALAVYPAGAETSEDGTGALWIDQLTITGDSLAFTMVALGTENFRVNVYADNLELIPNGQARVRFVNAVRNVEQVSFINAANAGTLAGGLFFGEGTDNLNLDANTRTFNVSETGIGPFYRIESFTLVPGAYYSFIVVGDGTEPDNIDLILLERLP